MDFFGSQNGSIMLINGLLRVSEWAIFRINGLFVGFKWANFVLMVFFVSFSGLFLRGMVSLGSQSGRIS